MMKWSLYKVLRFLPRDEEAADDRPSMRSPRKLGLHIWRLESKVKLLSVPHGVQSRHSLNRLIEQPKNRERKPYESITSLLQDITNHDTIAENTSGTPVENAKRKAWNLSRPPEKVQREPSTTTGGVRQKNKKRKKRWWNEHGWVRCRTEHRWTQDETDDRYPTIHDATRAATETPSKRSLGMTGTGKYAWNVLWEGTRTGNGSTGRQLEISWDVRLLCTAS